VLKRVKDKVTLWRVNDGPWSLHGPRLQTNLRNGVQPLDHATGVRDDTDLFSEERIAQGECFVADLWVPAAWSNDLAKWLSGTQLPVGRGGGRLQVSAASAAPNQAAGTGENQAEAVTLTLASDFAVRADDLGWCGDLGIATWRALFGAAWPADVQVADGGRGPQELSETVVLRGYNRTTGLPRWPVIAVKAGSAVRLLGPATAVARVRKLLTARPAHGERTQDGLGRVVLDLDIHAGLPKTTEARPATRTAGNRDRLDLLAQRLLAEPCKLQLSRSQRYDAFAGMRGNSTKAAREWIAAQVAWAKARGIDAAVAESMVRTTFADGALQASEGK
ncbi:MAG: hypothetical protein FJ100_22955, partial [Deltaproteobacteria bacterium]|nr:hypothetical protein [Deltaproteobacteria bacterium]